MSIYSAYNIKICMTLHERTFKTEGQVLLYFCVKV